MLFRYLKTIAFISLFAFAELGLASHPFVCDLVFNAEKEFNSNDFQKQLQDMSLTIEVLLATQKFVTETLRRYPPGQFRIVNLGLNSTLISAFMRATLPPEIFRKYVFEVPVKLSYEYLLETSPKERKAWFEKVFPFILETAEPPIVINRALMFGSQMIQFIPALRKYLKENENPTQIQYQFIIRKENNWDYLEKVFGQSKVHFYDDHFLNEALSQHAMTNTNAFHFRSHIHAFRAYAVLDPDFQYTLNPAAAELDESVRLFLIGYKPKTSNRWKERLQRFFHKQ